VIEQEFSVSGSPDIELRVQSGRIEVNEGDPGTVRVELKSSSPGYIVEQRGDTIVVSSERDSWLSRGSAYVVVDAPASSNLTVSTASANIDCSVGLSRVSIKTASGDIDLTEVEVLAVKSASGDLDVETVHRSLVFSSASGDVRVGQVDGTAAISTASGDVHIESCQGALEVSTSSGDTYISRFTGRQAGFKSMSGSIDLGIPPRTKIDLDVNLISGKLRLPEKRESSGPPEREMTVAARSVSGDVRLSRA
jgi:DUF4097 and DUF4098 domain-containing protein YvlB